MERALHERDQIGVEDFVLLEDHHNPEAFVDNLRKRFNADLIYTYIGPVLVSVNPYKELNLYTKPSAFEYKGHNYYEQPPHVFALINEALTSMIEETKDQCILISGESGSGKTEASKKLLQYIGFVCDGDDEADGVRDRLIQSNPVLEAFGNAKTTRNDNSSRFGKYMDVQFNFLGKPSGGHIRNYLLEKSRVVAQSAGECNFHIFHLLLAGATDDMLKRLCLQRDPSLFNYTKQSGHKRAGVRDGNHFQAVMDAMTTVGFNSDELEDVMAIVAAILHLGNISFLQRRDCDSDEGSHCRIDTADQHVQVVAQVLDIPVAEIHKAFTHRTIEARTDVVTTKLSVDQGTYARDALSKAVYDRLFSWLVNRLNTSLASKTTDPKHLLLGILDIYGFEVFTNNSFEQFCINYCNEKLQQLFIELTLKSEQEEYLAEGIAWEPVEYFNNKIICDMIELKHTGIISLLDEECLRPGEASDLTFLDKMNSSLRCHPHFMSHQTADNKTRKTINRDEFRLMHYAGEVTYSVKTFIDKNNDLLYRDLKEVMSKTSNRICQELFPTNELIGKKMPETVSTQFKRSLDQLMNILMSKEPSYVRCIKPNDTKQAWKFDSQLVAHQVKYLGLMENLRVRRAGFAYRRPFLAFLQRYKSLCPSTWPAARGPARHAVDTLMQHMGFTGGDDYSLGKTKIFIRMPKTIFQVEDAFQLRKHELATILSKTWKGHRERVKYIQMRESAIVIEKHVRGLLARRAAERRRWAVKVIRRFIVGFTTRNDSETEVNRRFVAVLRCEWLLRLSRGLPETLLDRKWPPAPPVCQLADQQLQQLHHRWMVRRYVRQITPGMKYVLEQKVLAERLFKDKKSSYEMSVPEPFRQSRLTREMEHDKSSVYSVVSRIDASKVHYCAPVVKYDRHGYKPRNRWFVVTSSGIHVVEAADKPKLKDHFTFSNVHVIVTAESDNLILFKKPQPENNGKEKGDLILLASNVIETVTKLAELTDEKIPITIADSSTLTHEMRGGKEGRIELCKGPSNSAHKEKEGYLVINYS